MTVRLANVFAAKIRSYDRTATSRWRQVPSRSSTANTSPAISDASNGNTYRPEKPSSTSGPAQPVALIQRPKVVSEGSELCWLTTATNPAGPIRHASNSRRTRHCDNSFTSSKR